MQAIIDIILAALGIPPCFIWRGNRFLSQHDFGVVDFTQDGAWHELDLSAIAPENTTAVSVHLKGSAVAVGGALRIRPSGSTNSSFTCRLRPQVANVPIAFNPTISVSSDRKIEYMVLGQIFNLIDFTVLGWWF